MGLIQAARQSIGDLVHNTIHARPDVVLIGETHRDVGNKKAQVKFIEQYRPEIVLFECFGEKKPEDLQHISSKHKVLTLGDVANECGISLSAPDLDYLLVAGALRYQNEKLEATNNIIESALLGQPPTEKSTYFDEHSFMPQTREQLLNTPIYEFNVAMYEQLREFAEGNQEMDDGFLEARYVDSFKHPGSPLVYRAIANIGAQMAGIDLQDKLERYKAIKERVKCEAQEKGVRLALLRQEQAKENLNVEREEFMGTKISEYCAQRQTRNPLVAIVGGAHTRNGSSIFPVLDSKGVSYNVINQKITLTPTEMLVEGLLHQVGHGLLDPNDLSAIAKQVYGR